MGRRMRDEWKGRGNRAEGRVRQKVNESDAEVWRSVCGLAGRLAEMGVARVTMSVRGVERVLVACETDLPRELAGAPIGARLSWDGGAMVRDTGGWREARADDQPFG